MNISLTTIISFIFILLGVILAVMRQPIASRLTVLYKKIGIDVDCAIYAKQFLFVGILLMLVGFLGVTGLLQYF